jgi:hypothetical protein
LKDPLDGDPVDLKEEVLLGNTYGKCEKLEVVKYGD